MEGPLPMVLSGLSLVTKVAILASIGPRVRRTAVACWLAVSMPRRPVDRKRPSRRKATASRAASAENSRPLWLAAITAWSARPGSRVSATATVPSCVVRRSRRTSAPSPCGDACRRSRRPRPARASRSKPRRSSVGAAPERCSGRTCGRRMPPRRAAAAQRRAQADHARHREFRVLAQGLQRDQAAEAVGEQVRRARARRSLRPGAASPSSGPPATLW